MEETVRKWLNKMHLVDQYSVPYLSKKGSVDELYEDVYQTGELQQNRITIQLLGDSRAGKTSLRKHIMGERFDPNEGTTLGIETRMCEHTLADDNWKRVDEIRNDEFNNSAGWLIAKKLTTTTEREGIQHGKIMFLFILLLFATLFFIQQLRFQNIFIFTLGTGYLLLRCLIEHGTAFEFSCGVALYAVFADTLFQYFRKTVDMESIQYTIMFSNCLAFNVGFAFGTFLGFGFHNGTVIALIFMLAPASEQMDAFTATMVLDRLVWIVGAVFGLFMIATITDCKLWKNCTIWLRVKFVILLSIVFGAVMMIFSDLVICSNAKLRILFLSLMISLGIVPGLEFGRSLYTLFWVRVSQVWWHLITISPSVLFAYLCGWSLPLNEDLPSLIAISGLFIIVYTELHRTVIIKRTQLARSIKYHARQRQQLQTKILPIRSRIDDFAGNTVFYDSHQLFIASHAIFLLVFNLERFEFENDWNQELENIVFWLQSIYTHSSHPDSLIFLVGTRRDSVPYITRTKIASFLKDELYNSRSLFTNRLALNKNKTPLFVIENSSQKDDKDVMNLKNAIHERTLKSSYMKEDYPVRWLHFFEFISAHRHDDQVLGDDERIRPIAEWVDAYEYAKTNCAVKTNADMENMLEFFHQAGYILYHKKDPVLRQYVILDPQLLVNIMKCIKLPKDNDRQPKMACHWIRLSDEGIIHSDLLQHLFKEFNINANCLVTLLETYGFICPIGRLSTPPHGFEVEEYIVPSMRPVYRDDPDNLGPEKPYKMFFFDFGLFKPDSIMLRLMAKCIQISKDYKVFRNIGIFNLDEEFVVRLEVVLNLTQQHLIKVSIKSAQGSNPYIIIARLNGFIQAMRCREFECTTYTCGILCTLPHENCQDILHILPLAKNNEEFPAIGSTITRYCKGVPQTIDIKPDEIRRFDNSIAGMRGTLDCKVKHTQDEEPLIYDVYVICSKNDELWVKHKLIRVLENDGLLVRVNAFVTYSAENLIYLKQCPVVMAIISRHSVKHNRCKDERELSYLYHDSDHVIHIFLDNHPTARAAMKKLNSPCFDALEYKVNELNEVLLEHIKELLHL